MPDDQTRPPTDLPPQPKARHGVELIDDILAELDLALDEPE